MVKQENRSRDDGPTYRQQESFREQIVPYAVLGLSLGSLALSMYAVVGGPMDNYLAKQQGNTAYASEIEQPQESSDINEVVGEGEYDISVQVDANGERSYVLTPKESDSSDAADNTDESTDSDDASSDDDSESSQADNNGDDTDSESDSSADEDDGTDTTEDESDTSDDDNNLSEEEQAKLDEHKSNRLRIQPDREGQDIYYYVVESGDTLAMISEEFDVPMGQLMEDNHIEDANYIYVGEVIFMPTDFVQ